MTSFTVEGHRLLADGIPVPFRASPNIGSRITDHRFLVEHFTSGSYAGAVSWLCDPAANASAHVVIAEDGGVTQLVPFDRVAWHAGRSSWRDVQGSVNAVSLGIEIANYGDMIDGGPGSYRVGRVPIPDDRVLVARHKSGGAARAWHTYPAAQIEAVIGITRALVEAYGLEEIIGHDDVAPGRKVDPGPAFPMDRVRAAAMTGSRPSPSPSPAAPAPTGRKVETVEDVQGALVSLGYGPLAIDGDAGPETRKAVARFQGANGLFIDGVAGPNTKAALSAVLAKKRG